MQDNLPIASAGPWPLGTPAGAGYNSGVRERALQPLTSLEQARRIAGLAEEKLAQDIVILDMRPVCAYTDFFVVCSGQNPRQTKSIVDEVRYGLKQDDEPLLPHAVEGEREGDWIVADYLDVVLHVFTPETRKLLRARGALGRRAVDRARDRQLTGCTTGGVHFSVDRGNPRGLRERSL